MIEKVISIENLSFLCDNTKILNNISFSILKGETINILGMLTYIYEVKK